MIATNKRNPHGHSIEYRQHLRSQAVSIYYRMLSGTNAMDLFKRMWFNFSDAFDDQMDLQESIDAERKRLIEKR